MAQDNKLIFSSQKTQTLIIPWLGWPLAKREVIRTSLAVCRAKWVLAAQGQSYDREAAVIHGMSGECAQKW